MLSKIAAATAKVGVTVETANDAGIKRSGVATLFSTTASEVGGMREGELATSNDPHGTCDGDSGGPTFMTLDGLEVVVGVTSRGSETGGQSDPCGTGRSVATRADSYAAFIDEFADGPQDPDDDDDTTHLKTMSLALVAKQIRAAARALAETGGFGALGFVGLALWFGPRRSGRSA